ncbi:MAG: TonB-dependent receptor [Thiogranum sp.]|nr:TonB-dependent receptor [Thiogranum sp.]
MNQCFKSGLAAVALSAFSLAEAGTAAFSNAFNPALSVILQGSVNSYSRDPDAYALPGFQLGGEAGPVPEGFTLDESEITASANVDHLFYAETTIGLHEDEDGTEVEIEQAFVQPLQLPVGLGGRFGRFYSGVGYLNRFHSHAWDFHDEPLVYRAFLGAQYRDDGVRLSWTAPSDLYVMLGGETLAGNRFPAGQSQSVTGEVQTLFAKIGGDVGMSHAWQAGISGLFADARDREGGGHGHGDADGAASAFSGDSDLLIAEVLWKWAPDGNPRQRNLILQGEYFYREERGDVMFAEAGNEALLDYDGEQQGWYAQVVYQFMPYWRAGVRYDWLESDNRLRISDPGGFTDPDEVLEESGFSDADGNPERWSLMLDWTPSEFSRVRAQYNRDESLPGVTDNQWSLQYIMSLGSHGAHEF